MNIKLLSIDLAKNVFQICAINQAGKPIINKKVTRKKLVETVIQLNPKKIVMESCYTANYWGREFQSYQFEVGTIPAQFVKPFVRGNKNDCNDAKAIAEAALRPDMRFVPIKTIEQQDLQALHRIRERHIRNRTALLNQIRGLLSEYGIAVGKSRRVITKMLPEIIEEADNGLTTVARYFIEQQSQELSALSDIIEKDEQLIESLVDNNEDYHRLMTIPGIGPTLSSAIIASIGNANQFSNARELSSWLGLTPLQSASGENSRLGGITKRGNRSLRTLFIHGARAAFTRCKKRNHYLIQWAERIALRRGKPKAWVALANKLARIAWALLTNQTEFRYRAV